MSDKQSSNAYWQANVRIIWICMAIWALVSYGFGILLRPMLSPCHATLSSPLR